MVEHVENAKSEAWIEELVPTRAGACFSPQSGGGQPFCALQEDTAQAAKGIAARQAAKQLFSSHWLEVLASPCRSATFGQKNTWHGFSHPPPGQPARTQGCAKLVCRRGGRSDTDRAVIYCWARSGPKQLASNQVSATRQSNNYLQRRLPALQSKRWPSNCNHPPAATAAAACLYTWLRPRGGRCC